MPVHSARSKGKPGFQWGGHGHIYTYEPGDEKGKEEARRKAGLQGQAAHAAGFVGKEYEVDDDEMVDYLVIKRNTISFDRTFSPKPDKKVNKGCGKKKVNKEMIFMTPKMDPECDECEMEEDECPLLNPYIEGGDNEETPDIGTVDIAKVNDKQWVFGWANISITADGDVPLDWQGDITAPAILEKAAYNFVLKFRGSGEQHVGGVVGQLIESVVFTQEKMKAMGLPEGILPVGWWVGVYIADPEVFAKVKSGQYKMFSIQGKAKRLKV